MKWNEKKTVPLVVSFKGIPRFIPAFPTYRTSKFFKLLNLPLSTLEK